MTSTPDGFPPVTVEEWERSALGKAPEGTAAVSELEGGIAVKWLYTEQDELAGDPGGEPGAAPWVRGARTGEAWDIRQEHGAPARPDAAAAIQEDLEGGATSVALRIGLDRGGVALATLDDLDEVLDGVYVDLAPLALDAGARAFGAAALALALWERREHDLTAIGGALRFDPLGSLAADGESPGTPPDAVAAAGVLAAEADRLLPAVTSLAVDSRPYVDAGATAVQELVLIVGTAVEYLRSCDAAGLPPERAAARIELTVSAGSDQFLELAKLRALRRLWARVLEVSGVPAEARRSPVYARTSRRMMAGVDPWNNMLRATTAAFAAAAGGADGITVSPFDAVLGPPSPLGRRVARNTQMILLEESGLARVADPAGGSWYVEALTDELARAAWAGVQELEAAGGMTEALVSGRVAQDLADSARRRDDEIARRVRTITGVNTFPLLGDDGLVRADPPDLEALARLEAERLAERREDPDLGRLDGSLRAAADLARDGARIDELSGRIVLSLPLPAARESERFERLRAAADAHEREGGDPSRIRLHTVGPLSRHTATALWARSFFEAGGLKAETDVEGARLVAVCAGPDEELEAVRAAVAKAREQGAETVYLAASDDDRAREAGADAAVRDGQDMLEVLTDAQRRAGVEVDL